jgi:hypothetical protein
MVFRDKELQIIPVDSLQYVGYRSLLDQIRTKEFTKILIVIDSLIESLNAQPNPDKLKELLDYYNLCNELEPFEQVEKSSRKHALNELSKLKSKLTPDRQALLNGIDWNPLLQCFLCSCSTRFPDFWHIIYSNHFPIQFSADFPSRFLQQHYNSLKTHEDHGMRLRAESLKDPLLDLEMLFPGDTLIKQKIMMSTEKYVISKKSINEIYSTFQKQYLSLEESNYILKEHKVFKDIIESALSGKTYLFVHVLE